jgi:DNA gyrase subunit A
MTEGGTIKRIPSSSFRTQRRNGKGVRTQEDITSAVIRTNTIDSLMIFSDKGKMYRLLVNDIPVGTNVSKGQSIKSLINMEIDESPAIMYSIYRDTDAKYVLFTTKNGLVKKTSLDEYVSTKKKTGIGAITLREGDSLASVSLIKDEPIVIITAGGYMLKCNSSDISATSRMTSGVKGINLGKDDYVVAALPIRDAKDELAIFSEHGFGKKLAPTEMMTQKRGGKGIICFKGTDKLAAAALVSDGDMVLICGDRSSICIDAKEIPQLGRATTGNQMLKDNKILSVSKV